jgi:hypothetical protein
MISFAVLLSCGILYGFFGILRLDSTLLILISAVVIILVIGAIVVSVRVVMHALGE